MIHTRLLRVQIAMLSFGGKGTPVVMTTLVIEMMVPQVVTQRRSGIS